MFDTTPCAQNQSFNVFLTLLSGTTKEGEMGNEGIQENNGYITNCILHPLETPAVPIVSQDQEVK